MRITKLIIMAMLFAFVSATLAHAGMQVQTNQTTIVKASVQNNTNDSTIAAVKLTGFDDAGVKVGQLCKEVWLKEGNSTAVEYSWNAPAYATGVYWQAKVEAKGDCPNAEIPSYDFHDYHDYDSDSDDGDDSDHH